MPLTEPLTSAYDRLSPTSPHPTFTSFLRIPNFPPTNKQDGSSPKSPATREGSLFSSSKIYLLGLTSLALFTAALSVLNLFSLRSQVACLSGALMSLSVDKQPLLTSAQGDLRTGRAWTEAPVQLQVPTPQPQQNPINLPSVAHPKSDMCSKGQCHNPTSSGHCPKELLAAYDEAYRDVWPARVDLLVRYYVNVDIYRIQLLFHSIDLFWPKNIGDIIVVLDEGQEWGASLLPYDIKVFYEKNYLNLPGKVLQQWSYFWADNYTTAEYVSVVDDDTLFVMKVTPSLLFNLTTGKPYVLGHKFTSATWHSRQHFVWAPSSDFFLGRGNYWGMFMNNLPFTFPRSALPKFREFAGSRFPQYDGDFDLAMQWWGQRKPSKQRNHICHTVLGNFMKLKLEDKVQIVHEQAEESIPIPRTGSHHSYSPDLYLAQGKMTLNMTTPREFQDLYIRSAGQRSLAALCDAFPPEARMEQCRKANMTLNRDIWVYVDWPDWHRIFQAKDPSGTVVYDIYKEEMTCLYEKLDLGCASHRGEDELHNDLRSCVRRDSSYL